MNRSLDSDFVSGIFIVGNWIFVVLIFIVSKVGLIDFIFCIFRIIGKWFLDFDNFKIWVSLSNLIFIFSCIINWFFRYGVIFGSVVSIGSVWVFGSVRLLGLF